MSRRRLAMVATVLLLLLPPILEGVQRTPHEAGGLEGVPLEVSSYTVMDRVVEASGTTAVRIKLTEEGAELLSPTPVDLTMAPGKLREALERLPGWLRKDTFNSLYELLSEESFPSPLSVESQDLNSDGREDLLIGGQGGYRAYLNVGGVSPPRFVETLPPTPVMFNNPEWFDPYILDLDMDGDLDLIAGVDQGVLFELNLSEEVPGLWIGTTQIINTPTQRALRRVSISYLGTQYLEPLGGEAQLFIVGELTGNLYVLAVRAYVQSGNVEVQYTTRPLGKYGVNATSPCVTYYNLDSVPDLIVGDGAGEVRFYLGSTRGDLFSITFDRMEDEEPVFQRGFRPPGPITPLYMDLSGDQWGDLLLACGDGRLRYYYHTTVRTETSTFWDTSEVPLDPAVQNYRRPPRSLRLLPMDLEEREAFCYVEAILNSPARIADEIAFVIAHTPRENLLYDPLEISRLVTLNAQLVYQIAEELKYVRLKDVSSSGGLMTTASYRVRWLDDLLWMDIPPDVYYWYVVHPRVTEELALWIDPETGNYAPPEEGGEFWREYLFYHADESYPPDPSPDHCYPKDFSPPLLKEVLSQVEVAWDGIPYTAPRGIDGSGRNNTRPFGFRDHAIEAISNWVEKSLPLNQQESGDNERPIQPVRIYHTHNGNCGELQDLTVAAARTSLIPARGVCLTGEDHVWSEFYMGGWHQWDNYWSDGGSVVDHFMNYWWEWGRRGGSGVYAWRGDDAVEDVTLHYLPENQSATLNVYVMGGGAPVEGARVLVMSDWISTHEVGSPVAVPAPAIWNYTNWEGRATFHLAANTFTVRVASTLGTYTSPSFELEPGEVRDLYVRLRLSTVFLGTTFSGNASLSVAKGDGPRYLLTVEPLVGYTPQMNFLTGYWVRQPLPSPPLNVILSNPANSTVYSGNGASGELGWIFFCREPYVIMPISLPAGGLLINLLPQVNHIPWNHYRYRVTLRRLTEGVELTTVVVGNTTHMLLTAPRNFTTPIYNLTLSSEGGWCRPIYISPAPGGVNPEMYIGGGASYLNYMPWLGMAIIEERGLYPLNLRKGTNFLRASGAAGGVGEFTTGGYLNWPGYSSPEITLLSPPPHTHIPCGKRFTTTFHLAGHLKGTQERGFIGFDYVRAEEGGSLRNISVETAKRRGSIWVKYALFSPEGLFSSLMVRYILDAVPPAVSLWVTEGEVVRGESVELRLTAQDDVELKGAVFRHPGGEVSLNLSGREDSVNLTLQTGDWPLGDVNITVEVYDNAGLVGENRTGVTVIPPPDNTPPAVEIVSPVEGERFKVGERIVLRGRASDDWGISYLHLSGDFGEMDLLPLLSGESFEVTLNTDGQPSGERSIVVVAEDLSGNRGSDEVTVLLVREEEREYNPPQIAILFPEDPTAEYSSVVSFSGRVVDDTGIDSVEVSFDMGLSWRVVEREGELFTFTFNTAYPIENGVLDPVLDYEVLLSYPLHIRATDLWGNTAEIVYTLSIKDQNPPTINMTIERTGEGVTVTLTFSDNLAVARGGVTFEKGDVEETYRLSRSSLRRGEAVVNIPLSPTEVGEVTAWVEDPAGLKTFAHTSVAPYSSAVERPGGGGGVISPLIPGVLFTVVLLAILALYLLRRRGYHQVD